MINSQSKIFKILFTVLASWLAARIFLIFLPFAIAKPIFLIVLIAGAILGVFLIFRPKVCFMILFLIRPVLDPILNQTKMDAGGGNALGFGAVLNLLIIILAIALFLKTPHLIKKVPLKKTWIFFLGAMFLSCFYSPDRGGAFKLMGNFFSYFAMFIMPFLLIQNEKDLDFWIRMLVFSCALPVILTNADFITGGHMTADAGLRFQGPFTHPNILAFYLVFALTLVLFWIKRRGAFHGWSRTILILFVLNAALELLGSKTRNAWISVWAMMLLYGMMSEKKYMIYCLVAIPVALCIPSVQQRILEVFSGEHRTLEQGMNSWDWRLAIWKSSWELVCKSPILGNGLGSFKPLSAQFFSGGKEFGAHNTYLQILFESGALGLSSFIILLTGFGFKIFSYWKKTRLGIYAVAFVYVISYSVICFADNLIYYLVLNLYFIFFMALVFRMMQLDLRKNTKVGRSHHAYSFFHYYIL